MKSRRINHLLFDYARTIVEHPLDGAGKQILRNTGLTDETDIEFFQKAAFSVDKYLNHLDEGIMERDTYKRLLKEELPLHLHGYVEEAVDYHMCVLPALPGMLELLKTLKEDGFKLYLVSNLDLYHARQMHEIEAAPFMDDMIFSADIGIRKPYPGFFDAACRQFGVSPSECLFIDDLEENVQGARDFGIKSYVFHGDPQELERFIYSEAI
ncbi:MAG: HAD family hydrolase [Ruminococcaceae bacterium]|nr:HAD family hydrolase [Oscillospiraceae bacterium]